MHTEAYVYVQQIVQQYVRNGEPRTSIVDFGGRNINGTVRKLFPHNSLYVSVDKIDGNGVDVVSDILDYKPANSPDTVVCCEVLEHTNKGAAIIRHAYDMLQPYGLLIVTCATDPRQPHSVLDGGALRRDLDEYYKNVTPGTLLRWMERFTETYIEIHSKRGDLYALGVKDLR